MSNHQPKTTDDLETIYEAYIESINGYCHNRNEEPLPLTKYLSCPTIHNDKNLSIREYHELIIPGSLFFIKDLQVDIEKLEVVAELEIRLKDGRILKENVRYRFDQDGKIVRVWSVVEGL